MLGVWLGQYISRSPETYGAIHAGRRNESVVRKVGRLAGRGLSRRGRGGRCPGQPVIWTVMAEAKEDSGRSVGRWLYGYGRRPAVAKTRPGVVCNRAISIAKMVSGRLGRNLGGQVVSPIITPPSDRGGIRNYELSSLRPKASRGKRSPIFRFDQGYKTPIEHKAPQETENHPWQSPPRPAGVGDTGGDTGGGMGKN
ncbi:hypothetical protein CSOJ01_03994 [Colletotrichum sojae]|uniref:Uncharacterized protein n=1 Tax=Colletotrichum sojae TaxID=2175907 RepID=A0A8H6MZC7_9PEZI|nr:hypothetical protein CSOJ01_03994 [Colletotrichum sojae]